MEQRQMEYRAGRFILSYIARKPRQDYIRVTTGGARGTRQLRVSQTPTNKIPAGSSSSQSNIDCSSPTPGKRCVTTMLNIYSKTDIKINIWAQVYSQSSTNALCNLSSPKNIIGVIWSRTKMGFAIFQREDQSINPSNLHREMNIQLIALLYSRLLPHSLSFQFF